MKANTSMWDLLVSSKKHKDTTYEALENLLISIKSTPKELVILVGFKDSVDISFSNKDLINLGKKHNRALYIQAEVKGFVVPCVMVDDGSTINVCPFKVLEKLNMTKEDLTKSNMVIKAYDESKRAVEGTFKIVMKTGPIKTVVEFVVLDIPITYGLLLG